MADLLRLKIYMLYQGTVSWYIIATCCTKQIGDAIKRVHCNGIMFNEPKELFVEIVLFLQPQFKKKYIKTFCNLSHSNNHWMPFNKLFPVNCIIYDK